nr:hypothetical protein CFP56_03304 [Quercus suber]
MTVVTGGIGLQRLLARRWSCTRTPFARILKYLNFCVLPTLRVHLYAITEQTGHPVALRGRVRSCCIVGECWSLHQRHMTRWPQDGRVTGDDKVAVEARRALAVLWRLQGWRRQCIPAHATSMQAGLEAQQNCRDAMVDIDVISSKESSTNLKRLMRASRASMTWPLLSGRRDEDAAVVSLESCGQSHCEFRYSQKGLRNKTTFVIR